MIYTSGDNIVTVSTHSDLILKTFSVVMKNKTVEANKEAITKKLNEDSIKRDFKSLETILK